MSLIVLFQGLAEVVGPPIPPPTDAFAQMVAGVTALALATDERTPLGSGAPGVALHTDDSSSIASRAGGRGGSFDMDD